MNEKMVKLEALITSDTTNTMNKKEFKTFYSILAEEYCKSNNLDIRELISEIKDEIEAVNEKYGEYGRK